jgi:hypothetical protein
MANPREYVRAPAIDLPALNVPAVRQRYLTSQARREFLGCVNNHRGLSVA